MTDFGSVCSGIEAASVAFWPIGWHGRKTMWRIMKMDELKALAVTIRRLVG